MAEGEGHSLRDTLREWLRHATGRGKQGPPPAISQAQFRLTYSRFREILTLNDSILCLISEVEEKAPGRIPFAWAPLTQRLRRAQLDAATRSPATRGFRRCTKP